MKIPDEKIEEILFAPCGMNCMVCYKHCYTKKSCSGCLNSDSGKPEHCRKCKIKDCIKSQKIKYCYECDNYPCRMIKNLEKSYITRYSISLQANSIFVKEKGLSAFMKEQKQKYTCPQCGGTVSLHDAECSECGKAVDSIK